MTTNNVGPMVDELGMLHSQAAEIEKKMKALKATLAELGDGAYEGAIFRATVATSERSNLDMAAVREKLSDQFLRAHTTYKNVTAVSVKAKTGERIAA